MPGEHAELARLDVEADVARPAPAPRVAVGDALEGQHAHGSIPRRSANGAQRDREQRRAQHERARRHRRMQLSG